jgi:hypothetical protein
MLGLGAPAQALLGVCPTHLRTRELIEETTGIYVKTVDFKGELAPNGQIAVPPEIASQVPPGEPIQVVLRWGISEDDMACARRAAGNSRWHTPPPTRSTNC